MQRVSVAILLALVVYGTTAFSSDVPAPSKAGNQAEQIELLLRKVESLEKRIASIEEENRTLRKDFDRLTAHTEVGVLFDVERAMMIPSPQAVLR